MQRIPLGLIPLPVERKVINHMQRIPLGLIPLPVERKVINHMQQNPLGLIPLPIKRKVSLIENVDSPTKCRMCLSGCQP
jgi:hypothetical protein